MCTVRRATEENLDDIVQLSKLWASENITYGLAPNAINNLLPKLTQYFFVADSHSEIVGYIFGTAHVSEGTAVIPKAEKYLEIDEVYVHPNHRADGIGHKLVDQLLNEASTYCITRSVVYSASKQWEKIVGFYEKHGFKMWFVEMYK